jgi:excisionase family DNA binding protein
MIDLAHETLLNLEQAAERLIVHKTTLYRWITQGSKGVKLEAARVGGRWRTSEEALQRFSERLTGDQERSTPAPPPIRTLRQQQRHQELVQQELDEIFGKRRCETCRAEIVAPTGTIPRHEKVWCPQCLIKRRSATLGRRIRTFRWAALLSQKALSSQTGISTDNIRAYEFDEKKPPENHLAKLIEVLGNDLVSGLSEPGVQAVIEAETNDAGG